MDLDIFILDELDNVDLDNLISSIYYDLYLSLKREEEKENEND